MLLMDLCPSRALADLSGDSSWWCSFLFSLIFCEFPTSAAATVAVSNVPGVVLLSSLKFAGSVWHSGIRAFAPFAWRGPCRCWGPRRPRGAVGGGAAGDGGALGRAGLSRIPKYGPCASWGGGRPPHQYSPADEVDVEAELQRIHEGALLLLCLPPEVSRSCAAPPCQVGRL